MCSRFVGLNFIIANFCADMVIQLYKASLIDGNTGKRIKPRQGPTAAKKVKTSTACVHGGPKIMPIARILIPNWGSGRTTPYDDKHLKVKVLRALEFQLEY